MKMKLSKLEMNVTGKNLAGFCYRIDGIWGVLAIDRMPCKNICEHLEDNRETLRTRIDEDIYHSNNEDRLLWLFNRCGHEAGEWDGRCPYSNVLSLPFREGCHIQGIAFYPFKHNGFPWSGFILYGRGLCLRIEECAVAVGRKAGMDPVVKSFRGIERELAEEKIRRGVYDLIQDGMQDIKLETFSSSQTQLKEGKMSVEFRVPKERYRIYKRYYLARGFLKL